MNSASLTIGEKPWFKSYDEVVPHEIEVPDHTIHEFLTHSAQKHPEATAMVFKGKEISYRTLDQLTDAMAAALAANGFRKGDRAVIYMPNTPQFVISFYGILKAGGIVIATNPLYTERELEHQLVDCGAENVIVLSLYYNKLKKVQKAGKTNVKRIIVANIKEYLPPITSLLFTVAKERKDGHRVTLEPGDISFQDFLASGKNAPKPNIQVSGDDIALLQYTGGTTGLSKGAVGTHRNVVSNAYMAQAWLTGTVSEGAETTLMALPLFHVYGLVGGLILTTSLAGRLIMIPDPRDRKDVLSSITKYGVTLFPGVPAMYIAINSNPDVLAGKYDLGTIKVCLSGAAPLMQDTKREFEKLTGGKLVEAFGLSESLVATHVNPINGLNKPGSIGLPIPLVDAKIVDPETGERELGINEVGELIIKSPSIMQGYWQMPSETANTLRNGWLYTGDIARMDEDGYFFIEDRKKDMIIAGGYNIYPREVEEVLASHPAVLEVAVGGIMDPKRGETVKAWVVVKPDASLTAEELQAYSKEQLAAYKYPRMIEFIDELPKSTVGKVLKRELIKRDQEKMKS